MVRNIISPVMILFITTMMGSVSVYSQEMERKVKRVFQVTPDTELSVSNKFGRVHINTWEENQISVEVVITAEMRNENKTREFLDDVQIKMWEGSSRVSLETVYKDNQNNNKEESFSVNYTISMPSANALTVENKFGDIYIADLTGKLDIDLKYGNLKGAKLTGSSEIEMGFGGGNIEELGNSDLDIKYSNLTIYKILNTNLEQGFSDIEIEDAGNIDLHSKYGSLALGTIKSVEGSAGFTDFRIDEVSGSVDLDLEYVGGFRISKVKKEIQGMKIAAKFTSMDIKIEEGVSADFEAQFKFSDLHARDDVVDLNYVVKDNNTNEYRGQIGTGGRGLIKIDSSYGDLRLSKH